MNATQLATELGITKGRVSQYVSEGKLDGCFTGDGRARRFDVGKVRAALDQRLDPGQMGAVVERDQRDALGRATHLADVLDLGADQHAAGEVVAVAGEDGSVREQRRTQMAAETADPPFVVAEQEIIEHDRVLPSSAIECDHGLSGTRPQHTRDPVGDFRPEHYDAAVD